VYEINTVGIHKVEPMINAGDDGSHAVYPRASKVLLIPPLGKLDASGSCCDKASPENFSIPYPSDPGSKN
jgi:hypothetical protein